MTRRPELGSDPNFIIPLLRWSGHRWFGECLELRHERLRAYDARKAAAERIDRPLLDRIHTELFAGHVPVLDGERHRAVDHEIHRVAEVCSDARGGLAALFHL